MIAVYKRLSIADGDLGKDGKDESNSIENQGMLIQEYLLSRDDLKSLPYREYTDDGFTGLNFDRPGFKKMMLDIKCGEIDTVVVKDLSRFGRDYVAVGEYLEKIFPVLGVRFIAINNTYDSVNYKGTAMGLDIAVANLVNTLYSRDVGKKLKSANRVKWKQGRCTGGYALFGYVFDPDRPNTYKLDPDAAKIVRRVYDLALLGFSTGQIAEQLNDEKLPIPSEYARIKKYKGKMNQRVLTPEKIWDSGKVWRVLNFYEYTGAMVRHKCEIIVSGSYVQRVVPKSQRIVVEGCHEAIVTKEEWEKAHQVIRTERGRGPRKPGKMPLRKKLRCGHCRRTLSVNLKEANPKCYCRSAMTQPKHSGCSANFYSLGDIESVVYLAIKKQIELLLKINGRFLDKEKEIKDLKKELDKDRSRIDMDIQRLKTDKIRFYEEYVDGKMTIEEYKIRKIETDNKIRELTEKLEKDGRRVEGEEKELKQARPAELKALLSESEKLMGATTLTDTMVAVFIENVYIHENKNVEIVFRFTDLISEAARRYGYKPEMDGFELKHQKDKA